MGKCRGVIYVFIILSLVLVSCTSNKSDNVGLDSAINGEKFGAVDCAQLSEKVIQDCSKNENWQVLNEGLSYQKKGSCDPAILESTTYGEKNPAVNSALDIKVKNDITLIADESVLNGIFCSDNPSSALDEAITQNKVKVEKKVFTE